MTKDMVKGFVFGAVLMLIAPAFALSGSPQPVAEEVLADHVSTPYFRLNYEDAEAALGQALTDRGAGGKVAATITNREGDNVFSYNQPIGVEIRGLRFDAKLRRFTANLVAVSGKEVVSVKAIAGRFEEMVEVPVLKRSVRAGDIITENDLEVRDYSKSRVRSDTATDMASLVGKSPERVISAGRPIRIQELKQPNVVKKNDIVKMVFNRGGMEISTSGQAMSDGGQGAVIAVKNLASKKLVQATVKDANTVLIDNSETRTSSLNTGETYAN